MKTLTEEQIKTAKKLDDGKSYPSREDRLKELTEQLTDGVKAVRSSDEYRKLLEVMAKFPNYSVNNCILIAMQKPNATLCQGFNGWKKMGRYVKKGEKGIRIIAPNPFKTKKKETKLDENGKPVLDAQGKPEKEEKEIQLMSFKVETTFDISQTEGKDLPSLGVEELKGSVDKFNVLMDVLKDISPVPIGFEDIKSGAKGYYQVAEKRIAIQKDMSELQTLKTCIHEMAHSMLHADVPANYGKNRKELEAEGTASIVLNYMGYDTSEYSYPYLSGYSTDEDLKELKKSLGIIRDTSSKIITKIEERLEGIQNERNPEIAEDKSHYELLSIHSKVKSFNGNATVTVKDNGDKVLQSFSEPVALLHEGKIYRLSDKEKLSNTVFIHLSEFAKQEIGAEIPADKYKDLEAYRVTDTLTKEPAQPKELTTYAKSQLFATNGLTR